MISLIETPTRLLVTGNDDEMAELKERFRYHPKNYFRSDAYQLWKMTSGQRGWDGYRYPLMLKTSTAGEMLRGRKQELLVFCTALGFKTDLSRCLVSPFKDVTLADIPTDLIEADFQLDANQRQAIVEWLRNGMGVANMAVNAGKTATFAAAASFIKRKFPEARFLYFTFAERLVKQVMESMRVLLPDWSITQYGGGGKRDLTGKDIVIATQAILNRNFRWLDNQGFFKSFHALLLDECVAGQTQVRLQNGQQCSIRDIARDNKQVVLKTLNEVTGQIENKLATAVSRGAKPLVRVRLCDRCICCTANHPFLTARGWVRADELTVFDSVLIWRDTPAATTDFWDFTGRWFDGHSRQVPLSEIGYSALLEPRSASISEIRDTQAIYRHTAENASQWRLGRAAESFHHIISARFRGCLRAVLSEWNKNNLQCLVSLCRGTGFGVVVHGRRDQKHSGNQSVNRELFIPGTGDFENLVFDTVGYRRLHYTFKAFPVVYSPAQACGAPFLPVGSSASDSDNGLQTFRGPVCFLLNLRLFFHSAATGLRILLRALLQSAQKPNRSGALCEVAFPNTGARQTYPTLEPVKIDAIERIGALEEVFDLCVNDNHNFFANGILVHNSHHCQSPTAEKVLRGCSAYFRLAASDSIKEGDPDKFNRISGLCGPVLCQVTSSALIEQSRSAAPHLYLVDIPTWQRKFAGVDHEPQPNSVAWTLVNDEWTKALYLGPVYQLERNGEVKMKKQRRLEGDRWKIEMVPMTVPTFHRLLLNGVETQVLARDTLLDRRYDRAIIRFKERNDLICDWTEHYVRHDWNTVVVATRTPHVVILEALLSARIPGRVRALTGEASTPLRNEMFSWFKRTKGAVLVTPLIKEGVSINEIRAGVVADVVADWEVAKQIIGRFMRKKQVANECHITWFIDRQHPRYFKNVADMMEKLGHIEGFTFHHPVAGPDTINQALIHKGQI